MAEYRIVIELDPDPDLSWLEQWNTPEKYAGNEMVDRGPNDNQPPRKIPFDEYIKYWGNPDRHVALCIRIEKQCEMGGWHTVECLGAVDMMDDQHLWLGTYSDPAEIKDESIRWEVSALLAEAQKRA